VLTYQHALVNGVAGGHKKGSALGKICKRESNNHSSFHGHQRATHPTGERASPRPILEKPMVHDTGSARISQELGPVAKQPTRRNLVKKSHHSLPRILHLEHCGAARPELLYHYAEKFFGNIDRKLFVRLESLALRPLTRDHAGAGDLK